LVNDLLLPEARALVANWNDGNRKEAAKVLAHIDGSGEKATQLVQNVTRLFKKVRTKTSLKR
jgi:hypothetical protein